ncbi:hybrid sensor histidine kinase/response regulator [Flagellimonas pacifica]|uniref:histidine kinase n=1 Tax=Flagellimonas pacifica TaxID=1247520 RepID=A0A285MD86_9FLAO|nr:ATP-binding protein [Allomuricauda parva]SNY94653.1 Signal transduction histidine kinase [Allomuricauda parva]
MLTKSRKRFTIKIIAGYLILGMITLLAGFFIYAEFNNYSAGQNKENESTKLLKTNSLLTELYEAENLSKLALQNKKRKSLNTYAKKVDSIFHTIEALKLLAKDTGQIGKLITVQKLLQQKVYNNAELRKLKVKNENNAPIDSLLSAFKKMETDLGRITPETFVPNFYQLPAKTQKSIREYVAILNENIPENASRKTSANALDSILNLSKSMLEDAKIETAKLERSMIAKELQIYKVDLELSQKLRSIISAFEQELIMEVYSNNLSKQTLLKRSAQFAWAAAILGFILVCVFTFLIANDYWKGQLYRERLEKEKRYSESLLKSREQLISTVSHDIRSPLHTLKGYMELLEHESTDNEQAHYFETMKSAAGYVENLMNDLLDFSKLEAGKTSIENVSFIISDLISETILNFEETGLEKSIPLHLEIAENLKTPIIGDPLRVRQILTNLIGNAFKFTYKGSVKIKAFVREEHRVSRVQIQVADTGIGIEKEKQELIFKEFVQAGNSSEEKIEGYGLGLTISKKLAELLGGTLEVESEVNKGSTFTFSMPLTFSRNNIPSKEILEPHFENRLSLIILDDDKTLLKLLKEICETYGLRIETFSSFEDLKKVSPLDYDVVLTDIQMPKISGFEVIKEFKKGAVPNYKSQPIIAMTGKREIPKSQFLNVGFRDVLLKPFSGETLLKVLNGINKPFDSAIEKINQMKGVSSDLFSTEIISSFLNSDQAIHEVLNTFLSNTDKNLKLLSKAVKKRKHLEIIAVSHKMLPMFRQLKVDSAVPILENFEQVTPNISYQKSLEDLELLNLSISNLKEEMQTYLTTLLVDNN